MIIYKKNKKLLEDNNIYNSSMEHDACGVGMVASTDGKKYRKIVEHGIEALKAIWHRGAVDADGKTGDGAGIHIEIPVDFFAEKIETKGHKHESNYVQWPLFEHTKFSRMAYDPHLIYYSAGIERPEYNGSIRIMSRHTRDRAHLSQCGCSKH